ncbi:PCP reductase family protein [Desulforudis sp. DRI-14]|uniref:PCP reductase family protein n=1 Tax=Desulforudis sp. DRI-14 TaxID=3459793 RepID=UPI003BCADA91
MDWDRDALAQLEKVPFFVRRMAKRLVEEMVSSEGRNCVTKADVIRAKNWFLHAAGIKAETTGSA